LVTKNRWALTIFVLSLLGIVPIWIVARPPLLDYPNHLARNFVLFHLNDPQYHFAQWFKADWGLYPYVGMDIILVWLQHFVSIETAGKIFISLCVLALPLSVFWFLRWVNKGHDLLAFFALFVTYDMFLLQGFLNFKLSLAACFFICGLWFWYWEKHGSVARWVVLLLATTATYFIHLIGFAITGMILFLYLVFSRSHIKAYVQLVLLFLPGCVLFLLSRPGLDKNSELQFRYVFDKVLSAGVVPIHGFSAGFDNFALLILAVSLFVAYWRNPEFKWNGPWPFVLPALFAFYWLLPLSWGQTFDIDIRLLPALFILLLSCARVGRRQKYLAYLALLLFAARLFNVTAYFRGDQKLLADMSQSFQHIAPGAKVLPIVESADDQDQLLRPYAHFWAYAVIERGAWTPYLFDIKGQTPLRMTYDPYAPDDFWDLEYKDEPEWKEVQNEYDYVWVYQVPRFLPALDGIGDVVYESGYLRLYKVRKTTPPPGKKVRKRARPKSAVH
jgi:hypothetical protein